MHSKLLEYYFGFYYHISALVLFCSGQLAAATKANLDEQFFAKEPAADKGKGKAVESSQKKANLDSSKTDDFTRPMKIMLQPRAEEIYQKYIMVQASTKDTLL